MLAHFVFVALWAGILAAPSPQAIFEPKHPTIEDIITDCSGDYHVPLKDLVRVLTQPGSPIRPDPMLQCSVLCYMNRAGFMDSEGYLKIAEFKANATSSNRLVYDSIMECKDTSGDNHCNRAYHINMCIGLRIFEKQFDSKLVAE